MSKENFIEGAQLFKLLDNDKLVPLYNMLTAYSRAKMYKKGILNFYNFEEMDNLRKDLVQTVFEKLYNGKRKWNKEYYPELIDCLKGMFDSELSNHLKKNRIKTIPLEIYHNICEDEEEVIDESEFLKNEDALEHVLIEIKKALTEEDYIILMKGCLEGLQPRHIAEQLKIKITEVNNSKKRAARVLQNIIKKYKPPKT